MKHRIVAALFAAAVASPAVAQSYPNKPVRLIVPFAPGGGTDIMGRTVAQKLSDLWGQQVVVDNRGGGGTVIGTDLTVKAPADGYTIMLANIALALNPGMHASLPYDATRDLAPIILIASQATALSVAPTMKAANVKELLALAKSRPEGITYGTSGTGAVGHIAGEMLRVATGAPLTHVPYKGGSPAAVDVMAGQIAMSLVSLPTVMSHYRAGKLKVLAITDSKRSAAAPEIPTLGETIPGYAVNNWIGLLAPSRVPRDVVKKLNEDTLKAIRMPDAKEKLSTQGFDLQGGSAEEFGAIIRGDIAKYTKLIKQAGIKAN